jgi:branched-chain amino acid transport system ATP-binding protein
VISGFYHPYEGAIRFAGVDRTHLKPYDVGHPGDRPDLPERGAVQGHERARQHHDRAASQDARIVPPGGALLGAGPPPGARAPRVRGAIIDFLEIQAIRKTPAGRLPYGLQKRVELARALAAQPTLLLLDEPMAGMNVEEKEDMCRFILDVNDESAPPCPIEHDMGVE